MTVPRGYQARDGRRQARERGFNVFTQPGSSAEVRWSVRGTVPLGGLRNGIVKAMLEHSRGASGERRTVDINALVDEALNLAYHGARAETPGFNITLERHYDPAIALVEVNPHDMTRVLLNLFSNGFYAANKRAHNGAEYDFKPTLKAMTRDIGDGNPRAGQRHRHPG